MSELDPKDCPVCRKPAEVRTFDARIAASCSDSLCLLGGGWYPIAKWNRRPSPQAEGGDGQREQHRYCCENCGYVKGRPVKDCGQVAVDGTCKHPKNITPECHDNACPLIPPAALSKEAE